MFGNIQDSSGMLSMVLLMIGRESKYAMILIVAIMVFKHWNSICIHVHDWRKGKMNSIVLEGNITTSVIVRSGYATDRATFDNKILGILYFMRHHVSKDLWNSMDQAHFLNGLDSQQEDEDTFMSFLPIHSKEGFKITDDIYIRVEVSENTISKTRSDTDDESLSASYREKRVTFTLMSKKSMVFLFEFIERCKTVYDEYMNDISKQGPRIIKSSNDGYYKTFNLNTTKSFDNLHFEGKDALIARLNSFKDKSIYQRLGINDGLGLLFYGEPGTGKTSTIKAIAKYMDMDIILVPMNQLKTKKAFEDFFYTKTYNGTIPFEKRIYVFEEIDCNGWANIVRNRDYGATPIAPAPVTVATTTAGQQPVIIFNDREKERKKTLSEDNEPMSLGALLECIDGLIEAPGRIIIMTTNHPDHLDPALRRPGRIDMEIEFKRLRSSDIALIYQQMYDEEMPLDISESIPDYKYTQADVSRMLFKHHQDPSAFIEEITRDQTV